MRKYKNLILLLIAVAIVAGLYLMGEAGGAIVAGIVTLLVGIFAFESAKRKNK